MIKIPISKILFLDIETVGCCPDFSSCQTLNPKIADQFLGYFDWFQKRFPEDSEMSHDEVFQRRAPLVPEFYHHMIQNLGRLRLLTLKRFGNMLHILL